jgi:hypothetical protein
MKNGAAEKEGMLTELERTKLENFPLKHNAMQQQLNANLAERKAYIEKVEAAHPGYQFNEQTGTLVKQAPQPHDSGEAGKELPSERFEC